jgi:YHS domain-containing protein
MDLHLRITPESPNAVRASYACPCGCMPGVAYAEGAAPTTEGCCCGNKFAVGREAEAHLKPVAGITREVQWFAAPWGEQVPAVWNLKMTEAEGAAGDGHTHGDDGEGSSPSTTAIDPVCGMSVEPETARAKGLHSRQVHVDYFFCGRGCKLDFEEDPERYLDPAYLPSM